MRRLLLGIALLVLAAATLLFWRGAEIRASPGYARAVERIAGWSYPEPAAPPEPTYPVAVRVGDEVARVDPRFLSFAIDSSLLVGGRWWGADGRVELGSGPELAGPFDFDRPRLVALTRALAPAWLRIGGTEADRIWYDLSGAAQSQVGTPRGYAYAMTRDIWAGLQDYVAATGVDLFFTLNGGPGPRDGDGAWRTENAEALLAHAAERGDRVGAWELGNEPNVYWALHGFGSRISGAQYADDLHRLRAIVEKHQPGALLVGPATAWWPLVGELGRPFLGIHREAMRYGGHLLDAVTWHYYPQQSRRCPEATRRAAPYRALRPAWLADVNVWAAQVERLRDAYAPEAPIWMGEIGSAQCGGEPGVSDTYVDTLWWFDALGTLARRGHQVVVRQSLVGSHYALLDDALEPRPDYWASLLWQRRMGERVLSVELEPATPYLRAYAHCSPVLRGRATLLLINVHREIPAEVALPDGAKGGLLSVVDAQDPLGAAIRLNGQELRYDPDRGAASLALGTRTHPEATLTLAPLSSAFVTFPAGSEDVCR